MISRQKTRLVKLQILVGVLLVLVVLFLVVPVVLVVVTGVKQSQLLV